MDYFKMFYTAIGGLGIFFLGMKFLSEGLQSMAGDLIRRLINLATSNRILAVVVGLTVTAIVQSSSVSTVMVVGLVNAGLMELTQAIGVILGANIGTTITGWILAIKIGKYGLLLVGLGIFPFLFSRRDSFNNVGKAFLALGLVFFGLELMSSAFKPLRTDADFISLMHYFDAQSLTSLLGCVLIGCLLTFVVQSSSAMLGITIALANEGAITFPTAAALVLGENIGTTITAQLAAIGGNVNAKRAAASHTIFNLLGVGVMIALFKPYLGFVDSLIPGLPDLVATDGTKPNIAAHIAAGHSLFNVTAVLIAIPFVRTLAAIVTGLFKDPEGKLEYRLLHLDGVTRVTAGVGINMARMELVQMSKLVAKALRKTKGYLKRSNEERFYLSVQKIEGITDNLQSEITAFVCGLLGEPMSHSESEEAYSLIRAADELESITDYALSICEYKKRMIKNGQEFSEEAWQEMKAYIREISVLYKETAAMLVEKPAESDLQLVMERGAALNISADKIKRNHLERLASGKCEAMAGLTFSDMIVAMRRIKNHTINFAEALSFEFLTDSSTDQSTQIASGNG